MPRPTKTPNSSGDLAASLDLPRWMTVILNAPPLIFQSYRLLLALLLMLLFTLEFGPAWLGSVNPSLFAATSTSYLLLVVVTWILYHYSRIPEEVQVSIMMFIDIALITLMMHASGGVQSGLGMLMAVSIASGSLMLRGRLALLFAALATLAVLAEQLAAHIIRSDPSTSFSQSALLGMAFFAIALLAQSLSLHIRISERIASQQRRELANMAQLNEYVLDHMQTGVLAVDATDRLRLMNHAAWQLLGMPDAHEGRLLATASAILASQLKTWQQSPTADSAEFRPVSAGRDLSARFTRLGGSQAAGTLIFLEDTAQVTQQAQQMKLASIGRLTASIAHEIRNPLGAISHAGQLLAESDALSPADQRMTDIIRNNAERLNGVIENVLSLSRRSRSHPQAVMLSEWLRELVATLRAEGALGSAHVDVDINPENSCALFDSGQMQQVVSVLIQNAVAHFDREPDELRLTLIGGITRESGGPFIELQDNGPGVAADIARQIFEPFFTTRRSGTGLGLYIARELCETNQARLEYLALPNGGSSFHINLKPAPATHRPHNTESPL